MAAIVPSKRTNPRFGEIQIGAAVRARAWRDLAMCLHWVRAHGMHLVPQTSPHLQLSSGSKTLRFRVHPSGRAIQRIWQVTLRSEPFSGESPFPTEVDVTFPDSQTVRYYPETYTLLANSVGFLNRRIYIEELSAKSSSLTELTLVFAHVRGVPAWIESVSCFEAPRAVLTQDSTDRGVDLQTLVPGQAIFDGNTPFRSVAAVATGWVNTEPRRSLAQLYFDTAAVNSGSYTDIFELPVPIMPRKDLITSTGKTITWDVYARTTDGSTNGDIRISTTTGAANATLTINGSTTFSWRGTSTVAAGQEDLGDYDHAGLIGGTDFEFFQIAMRVTAGGGSIEIQAVSVWEAT